MDIILAAVGGFAIGVVFSQVVKAWFGKEQQALHDKLDKILHKVDPNATQPPK